MPINLQYIQMKLFTWCSIDSKLKQTPSKLWLWKNILEIARTTSFIGVIIDNKLKWTDHTNYYDKKSQNQFQL